MLVIDEPHCGGDVLFMPHPVTTDETYYKFDGSLSLSSMVYSAG